MDWIKLNEEKYQELTRDSLLKVFSLKELIELSINYDTFWEFACVYYEIKNNVPIIVIDREMSVGGYNNSELKISASSSEVYSNDKKFKEFLETEIAKKLESTKTIGNEK